MDIYDLFPSQDVAEYCRSIHHVFSPVETAALICKLCFFNRIPMEKQHDYYKELMACSTDMQFHESVNFHIRSSLHDYLRALIDWDEREVVRFLHPETEKKNCYYSLCSYDAGLLGLARKIDPKDSGNAEDYGQYSSFDELFNDIRPFWKNSAKVKSVRVILKSTISEQFSVYADISPSGKIIALDDSFEDENEFPGNLWDIHVNIPAPFKVGDLVRNTHEDSFNPYVIKYLPPDQVGNENMSGVSFEYYYSLTQRMDCAYFYYITENGELAASDSGTSKWGSFLFALRAFNGDLASVNEKLIKVQKELKSNQQKANNKVVIA